MVGDRRKPGDGATATDPVCGMKVDPAATQHHAIHAGQQYHFCSDGCRTKFTANPQHYLSKEAAPHVPARANDVIYTCPMHPAVRQIGPGSCPICGMALEPATVSLDTGPSAELADMTRRFWVALVLTLPVFALEMGGHLTGLMMFVGKLTSKWIQFVLATPVVLWAGWQFFARGWALRPRRRAGLLPMVRTRKLRST
jgi:YHS domain-containing protein